MSQEPTRGDGNDGHGPGEWEELLRSLLGPQAADEAIAAMRASGLDPSAMSQAAGLPADRNQLMQMITQMQQMMAQGAGEPVNWSIAQDLARQTAAAGGDPSVSAAEAQRVREALQVADLWLDPVTDHAPAPGPREAWSRATWVERTLPAWKRLAEPVAVSMTRALSEVLGTQAEHLPEELRALTGGEGPLRAMVDQMGAAVFGMQVGQALGALAREAFGPTELSLPLLEAHTSALVQANISAFTEGLDVPEDEVRFYLAVREAAHARLFAHVPWLPSHLLGIVESYSREIAIDVAAMEEAVRDIDPSDAEQLRQAMSGGVFALERTESQEAALLRLESALALVEGWVQHVTAQAVAPHLPHAVALQEMLARRRASGGPAEKTFAALVGLELRPRRLREAAALWAAVEQERGVAERDAVWSHPDLMPRAEDLDDPQGFAAGRPAEDDTAQDLDAALAAIFAEDERRTSDSADPSAEGEEGAGDPGSEPGPAHED